VKPWVKSPALGLKEEEEEEEEWARREEMRPNCVNVTASALTKEMRDIAQGRQFRGERSQPLC
jgi:hypothetical protein